MRAMRPMTQVELELFTQIAEVENYRALLEDARKEQVLLQRALGGAMENAQRLARLYSLAKRKARKINSQVTIALAQKGEGHES